MSISGSPNPPTEATVAYVRKMTVRNDYTLGIFVEDKPVSRICLDATGHLGWLRTLDGHQRQGYSTILLQNLARNLGTNTKIYPCSMVDIKNRGSNAVHFKAGLQLSHLVDFVIFRGDVF